MSRRLSDWIDSYLHFVRNTEPPHLYKKWAALSTIASALQRKCYLPWGSLTFYPNMYVVLVGPPAKARKGTAMGPALDLIFDATGIKLAAEATTREALIKALFESYEMSFDPETGLTTSHSSLTVHSQELTVFLGYQNYQLMTDLTDWYDCRKRWTYRTKHYGSDEIIGVWVNIFGATTPRLIESAMPMDAIGGGLTSRMIFVYEHSKGKTEPAPFWTDDDLKLREELLIDLDLMKMLQGPFRVTDEFVEEWAKWYTAQDDNPPPFDDDRFAGYFERRPTHVMKLSIILNAARTDSMTITKDDLENAIQLLKETEVKMPLTFTGVGKSAYASILPRVMAEIGRQKETSFEHLMRIFWHDTTPWDMNKIVETLEMMNFCKYVSNTGVIRCNEDFEDSYVH